MKRIVHQLVFGIILCVFTASTAILSTVAWFRYGVDIQIGGDTADVTGGLEKSYFGGGDGSEGNPYIISDKNHLYNLAWLQYIGYFNTAGHIYNPESGSPTPYIYSNYFKITNNIDMSGITLPPIGTEAYPFFGHLDGTNSSGGSFSISNLTISNDNPSQSNINADFGIFRPVNIPSFATQPRVVGFFGAIGHIPTNTTLNNYDLSSIAPTFTNLTLNNLTVKCGEHDSPSQLLIGLAAGYVGGEGTLSGVKVTGSSSLTVNGQSAVDSSITSKLSDYGLVGYSENKSQSGSYSQKLSEHYNSSDDGEAPDFGGSVDFKNITDFADIAWSNKNTASSNYQFKDSSGHTLASYTFASNTLSSYTYFMSKKDATSSSYTSYYGSNYYDDTYIPFSFHKNGSYYSMGSNNTGYMTSSDGAASGYKSSLRLARTSYNNGYISLSIGGSGGATNATTSIPSKVLNSETKYYLITKNRKTVANSNLSNTDHYAMIDYGLDNTVNPNIASYTASDLTSNNWYKAAHKVMFDNRMTVSQLDLNEVAFASSRQGVIQSLTARAEDNDWRMYGGRLMTSNNTMLSESNKFKIPYANILNESYSDYELLRNAIDFNLGATGTIRFYSFLAYNDQDSSHSGGGWGGTLRDRSARAQDWGFFDVYQVTRSSDKKTITGVSKIVKIYLDKSASQYSQNRYAYVFENQADSYSSNSNYELYFDMAWMNGDTNRMSKLPATLYYFEFPLNKGEYAFGSPSLASGSSKCSSGYLVYLDIAAAAEQEPTDTITAHSITTKRTGSAFPIGVDFAPVAVSGNGGESIGIYIPASTTQQTIAGTVEFSITQENTQTGALGSILIRNSSNIATYSFQGTKYTSSDPASGKFTVSGTIGNIESPPGGGVRVLIINLKTASGDVYCARITDELTDDNGTFTETDSTYELDSGSGFVDSSKSAINNLSEDLDVDMLRALRIAAVLTRQSGSFNEFVTTYDTENCSHTDHVIDVDIATNGTTIGIEVEPYDEDNNMFIFKIGGIQYSNGSTYSN